jgi:prolyl 4-hydroxylase
MPKRSSNTVSPRKPKKQKTPKIFLNDFVEIYDNVLDPTQCQALINIFESLPEKQEVIDDDKRPSFTQLNLTENTTVSEDIKSLHDILISKTFEYRNLYYEFVDERVFPDKHNFEYYRIKKYRNNGEDLFDTHVDVRNHESARRFLSFMFYLNDVEKGGETLFEGLTITPKCGRLVVFPPLWLFPHKGCCPVSNDKYILTTYLHYK